MAIEARGLVAQGNLSGADKAAKRAKEHLPKIQDRAQRIAVVVELSPVLAATGSRAEAQAQLSTAEAEAAKLGYGALRLEVLLAESELDRNPASAAQRLQAVEREAKAKGLGLIARKAATRLRATGK
jgi:hypothetical protein